MIPETEKLRAWVKTQVSPRRFKHIQGVVKTSSDLARRFGHSAPKARLAAWFHDCAKELSRAEMLNWLKGSPFRLDAFEKQMPGLWHPHAAAAIALKKWKMRDAEIIEAIRAHTLGGVGMGPLAQVVFVADFIEPSRVFERVQQARVAAHRGLTEGVRVKAALTLEQLLKNREMIHPRLVLTWNAFLLKDEK